MINLDNCRTMNDLTDLKVAKALVYNPENKILVLIRGDGHPSFPGHYDFPGGLIEDNENPNSAIRREIFEEIGLDIKTKRIDLIYSHTYTSNNNTHYIYKLSMHNSFNIDLSWEHKGFTWLSEQELIDYEMPEYVDGYFITVVNFLKNNTAS